MSAATTPLGDARARLRPVLDEIAASAARREQERILPFAELDALRRSGFLAARVPAELGGLGLSVTDLVRLCVELGAADPNVAQVLRTHFGFVEARRLSRDRADGDRWLRRVADGALVGNASSEVGTASTGTITTELRRDDDGLRLSGRKAYSTGALFADLVVVFAVHGEDFRSVVIPRDRPGVTVVDDWGGFGQRLTGSGTTILEDVAVRDDEVLPQDPDEGDFLFPYFQLHLLAALAGIARRVRDDAAAAIATGRRSFGYPGAGEPRHDPLMLERLGRLSAAAAVAEASVVRVARTIDVLLPALGGHDAEAAAPRQAIADAVAHAHVVVAPTVLAACRRFFDVGGAALVRRGPAHDRHWRNARAIASHNPAAYRARELGVAGISDLSTQGGTPQGPVGP